MRSWEKAPVKFVGSKVGKLDITTTEPSVTSRATTAPLQPLPVPMMPSRGAMRSARARSATYWARASMVRYTSLPLESSMLLMTEMRRPLASTITLLSPCSPAR